MKNQKIKTIKVIAPFTGMKNFNIEAVGDMVVFNW
jgi:hypothetical protein